MLKEIIESHPDESFLQADGFEDAVIGVCSQSRRLIYSIKKCIEILQERDGMEVEEATEFFYFNTEGAYVGELTPIWCEDNY